MSQYRTKRLTITKSYIEHMGRRYEFGRIAEAQQVRNRPTWIWVFTFLLCPTATIATVYPAIGALFLFIWVAGIAAGFLRPPAVILKTVDNQFHRLWFGQERSGLRAVQIVLGNLKEFQQKGRVVPLAQQNDAQYSGRLYPEEAVRQYVLELLTRVLRYSPTDIGYEFPIQVGSSQKRADVVVFLAGARHIQENILVIIECKRADIRSDSSATDQLQSYLSACVNARYGAVASHRWIVIEKALTGGRYQFAQIPALPDSSGRPRPIRYAPGSPVVSLDDEPYDMWSDASVPATDFPKAKLVKIIGTALIAGVFVGFAMNSVLKSQNIPQFGVPSLATEILEETALTVPTVSGTYASPAPVRIGVVGGDRRVNLRLAPTTDSSIVKVLNTGTSVTILSETVGGTWYEVLLNDGTIGWVAASLIRLSPDN